MKTSYYNMRTYLFFTVLAVSMVAGCTRQKQQENVPKTAEDVPSAPATGSVPDTLDSEDTSVNGTPGAAQMTRDEFDKTMTARLGGLDERIDAIEGRLEERGQEIQTAFSAQLTELRGNRQEAADQLNAFKAAGEDTWVSARDGVIQAFSDLESGVTQAEQWLAAH